MRYLLLLLILFTCLAAPAQSLRMNSKAAILSTENAGQVSWRVKTKIVVDENYVSLTHQGQTKSLQVVERYYSDHDYRLNFVLEDGQTFVWDIDCGRFLLHNPAEGKTLEFLSFDIRGGYQFLKKKGGYFAEYRHSPL